MTLFDLVAGLILAASALAGLVRGFTREVTTIVAFILAAILSFAALRFTGPVFAQAIPIVWMADAAALLVGFVFAYIVLRLLGGALTRRIRDDHRLSGPDRVLGLIAGLARGLIVIGAFALVVNAAAAPDQPPAWIARARLYPLASDAGLAMSRLAPRRFGLAGWAGKPIKASYIDRRGPDADMGGGR
ncbi:MAG: CvpA family protein [Caulobacteraceae bacterium]